MHVLIYLKMSIKILNFSEFKIFIKVFKIAVFWEGFSVIL